MRSELSEDCAMPSMERVDLLVGLKDQEIRIPNLFPIFPGWPQDINKHAADIVPMMNKILESNTRDESLATKLKQEELAMLTAKWWPYADLETLLDLARFVGCIFTVDGLVDEFSGPGKEKIDAFDALNRGTNDFIEKGLDPSDNAEMLMSSNPTIDGFHILSELLCKRYTIEQRRMFLKEAKFTMEILAVQLQFRIQCKVPTLEEYRGYREGSCCINAMIALVEYGNKLCIPNEIMQDQDMKALKKAAVCANWITNDIVSLKKEVASGFVENLVVLFAPYGWPQDGVDAAVELLRSSVASFESAASKLASRCAGDEALSKDIAKFVQGCRNICMGSYTWSLTTTRYGLAEKRIDASGGIVVTL